MTQSGQGEQPSARPAREGIVLPSDGGEPLLPGMPGTSGGGRPGGPAPAPPPTTTPAGGQSWGTPWGPEQQQTPPQAPGWTPPPAQPWGPPDGAQQQPASWGTPGQDAGALPRGGPDAYGAAPHVQQPHQDGGAHGHGGGASLPPAQHAGPGHALPPAGGGTYGHQGAAPLPPAGQGGPAHALPSPGAPLPPPGAHADRATHYLPPVAANAPDEGATQYIPPVGPGALPPEMPAGPPAESPAEATQFLGRAQPHTGHAGQQPHASHAAQHAHGGPQPGAGPLPPASGPDAEATQFMAPVAGQHPGAAYGERQPPAEFDNLFRSEPGASPAGATQQMPHFQRPGPPQAAAPNGYAPQGPGAGRPGTGHGGHGGDGGGRGARGGRGGSRVPLIAAIGVAIAVVGIGAGALLAGGGGGDDDTKQPVSATGPTAEESASPSADPAEAQAVELDKLLADSGDSRTSVISAVADVKACRNLDGAAQDLRDAAKQRTGLVTRLSGVAVDKLPGHAELTSALTKAWQASASADNHYAAWADQVAAKKGKCKKGQAPSTGQTAAGNRESGTASQQKARAAELWNAIAKTYGLTERRPTQL
ncbi:hypothetical protein ABZ354_07440 [Streptomyces sp. NPDC005925]|uniref:hypothetical protein n=1 Tax=Streptomyces sp. NPDC005925 TaxID=3157172 RepID=UPI0033D31D1A